MEDETKLLQFLVCREFNEAKRDQFAAEAICSNIYTTRFPYTPRGLYVVTCWQKDKKFHKEVVEFETTDGALIRTPHTDIEPITNSVLFRWHKHPFPENFEIEGPTTLTIRVILDNKVRFESYLLVEKKS
ncbi:MAG: hypothetical protein A3C35_01420 [Omnitrophica bacterium RIFCSPHIGHO2_02_FULL_46_11]|nr:MAG: hypothetical protein A3C35_01420 [Omnitrophica bacterium RIFCSPHIGHO2_02_FULL_46_11]OGW86184.1 MAG: hypothetical protein A3A81_05385 [Omnitrophica bacterium RIFCSPLOWO2_01_FULL_45_10b]